MATRLHTSGFDARLVSSVLDDALAAGARVYGISGLQGSGKSTLAAQVAAEASRRGLRCPVLSIDDVYLPRAGRMRLAREVHPLLATRGPPGTHEVALAIEVLDALRTGDGAALPRFDKLADERLPRAGWPRVDGADLVLFEGWFLGTPAEEAAALEAPVNALERNEDGDGRWRRWCNRALADAYPPLWRRIDRLLLLQAPSFEVVPGWRREAERTLAAGRPGMPAMDDAALERFVQHYERTSRQALRTLPGIADRVVALDARRRPVPPGGLSRPRS
ncbi:kinase [Luteimonas sp. Sa2BVA3]|uniref:Kinase n=1 Tax=Luteimonas colneyensis TaxID=2762230 RepID=A0ABR8UKR4_9GAMM|nr:kinase [Luteimonas colneyensis]MBD7988621.1 kinase [Luteimonas colneyensis]